MNNFDVLYWEAEREKQERLHNELRAINDREQLLYTVKKCLNRMNSFSNKAIKIAYLEMRDYVTLENLEKVVYSTWGERIENYSDRIGLVSIDYVKSLRDKFHYSDRNYRLYEHPYMWEKLMLSIVNEKKEKGLI
jgi:hypothetical protein